MISPKCGSSRDLHFKEDYPEDVLDGYACACMPRMGTKAYKVANAFRDNWTDTGKQGLILSIYEAWE